MAQPGETVNSLAKMLSLLEPLETGKQESLANLLDSDEEFTFVCKSTGATDSGVVVGTPAP